MDFFLKIMDFFLLLTNVGIQINVIKVSYIHSFIHSFIDHSCVIPVL
jgi:hypothetical protein